MSDTEHEEAEREEGTPRREAPYEDSGEWTGERCPQCTYTTMIDADAVDRGANFCGVCGNQLRSDEVLEALDQLPEQYEKAAE